MTMPVNPCIPSEHREFLAAAVRSVWEDAKIVQYAHAEWLKPDVVRIDPDTRGEWAGPADADGQLRRWRWVVGFAGETDTPPSGQRSREAALAEQRVIQVVNAVTGMTGIQCFGGVRSPRVTVTSVRRRPERCWFEIDIEILDS